MKVKELFINDQKEQEIFDDTIIGAILYAYVEYFREYLTQKAIDNIVYLYEYGVFMKYKDTYLERADHKINDIISLFRDKGVNETLTEMAEAFMRHFSKVERQKSGKVYTPQDIVDWIHTKLIEQSPLNLHKTYCDFACGTGHFVLDWYIQLMDHWRQNRDQYPEIRDEHEAHGWTIEKCLFFADIDPFAIRMCKMGLFLKDPEVVGLRFNSCVGDSLLIDPFGLKEDDERRVGVRKDEKYVEIFTWNGGNPPWVGLNPRGQKLKVNSDKLKVYKERYNTYNKYSDLLCLFVDLGLQRAYNVGLVTSSNWLRADFNGSRGLKDKIEANFNKITIWDHEKEKFFDVQETTACVIFNTGEESQRVILSHKGEIRGNIEGYDWLCLGDKKNNNFEVLLQKIEGITKRQFEVVGGIQTADKEQFLKSAGKQPYFIHNNELRGYRARPVATIPLIKIKEVTKTHKDQLGDFDEDFNVYYGIRASEKKISKWNQPGVLVGFYFKNKPAVCLDESGEFWGADSAVHKIITDDIYSVVAILNSSLMQFYMRCRARKKWGSYVGSTEFYRTLPISIGNIEKEKVQKMLQNPEDRETQAEIDKIVYGLYGLTEEEIKIIENSLTKEASSE